MARFGSFVCDLRELESGWPGHQSPNPISAIQLPHYVPPVLAMDLMSTYNLKDTLESLARISSHINIAPGSA